MLRERQHVVALLGRAGVERAALCRAMVVAATPSASEFAELVANELAAVLNCASAPAKLGICITKSKKHRRTIISNSVSAGGR